MRKIKMKQNICVQDGILMFFCYILMILVFVLTVYPFWQIIVISVSSRKDALSMGFHLWPKSFDFTAYTRIIKSSDFWNSFQNSIIRVVVATLLSLIMVSLTAYPLSKKSLPFKKTITWFFLFTMMFSGGLIPTYLTIKGLGLLNTLWALILPGVASAYNIVIMRNFMQSIPDSLTESALIDGANEFVIWYRIIIPLSKPALATIALWVAVVQWNAYLDALIYLTDQDKYVLPVLLRRMLIDNQTNMYMNYDINASSVPTEETVKSAMIVASIVPIVLVYPFIQKHFSKGIMLGAVKG